MKNLVENIEENLVVINVENDNAELIGRLKNAVASDFVSAFSIIDNSFDKDIDEVLKDYKVADLLVMRCDELHNLLSAYYWKIILGQLNKTYDSVSVGFGILENESPISVAEQDVQLFISFHTYTIDQLRQFAEKCRSMESEEEEQKKSEEPLSIINEIADFIKSRGHMKIELEVEDDSDEDDEENKSLSDWIVNLHIGYHPAYTIRELHKRISRRMRYEWDNVTATAIAVTQQEDKSYNAVIFVKYNEGSREYTKEEMEKEILYRFGKTCPKPWYRCSLVSVKPYNE